MKTSDSQAGLMIEGRFAVEIGRPGASVGGMEAFAATDVQRGGTLVALRVDRAIPAHGRADAYAGVAPGLMAPLASAVVGDARWFIVEHPGYPALIDAAFAAHAEKKPWGEAQILSQLIRPVAETLIALQAQGLTHRAIRPDNVFGTAEHAAVLGPCWAAAPGFMQEASVEPPWSAACLPAGRGEGTIADDVYALGVLALTVLLGRQPLAGLSPREIIERKLDQGSYLTLVGDERFSPSLTHLLRTMLADDPEQRPSVASLAELMPGRERRVVRRAANRAQRTLSLGTVQVANTQMLAWAMGRDPRETVRMLRNGAIGHWLRRAAEQSAAAARIDELVAGMPGDGFGRDGFEALLVMRAVASLAVGAPMLWEGRWLWPDALGAILWAATAQPGAADAQTTGDAGNTALTEALRRAISVDAYEHWGTIVGRHGSHTDPGGWIQAARGWRRSNGVDPILRLLYALNPGQPCLSRRLEPLSITSAAMLLPSIEAGLSTGRIALDGGQYWVDVHVASFLAAADSARREPERRPEIAELSDLARLAALAVKQRHLSLPHLAESLLPTLREVVAQRPGQSRRRQLGEDLEQRARMGDLPGMLSLLADPMSQNVDEQARDSARERIASLREQIKTLHDQRRHLSRRAREISGEVGIGMGLLVVTGLALIEIAG